MWIFEWRYSHCSIARYLIDDIAQHDDHFRSDHDNGSCLGSWHLSRKIRPGRIQNQRRVLAEPATHR
jgi:hypothetical protein